MTNEEKKAIEYLKSRLYGNEGCKFIDVAQSDLRIFLNLIETQQNEIDIKDIIIDLMAEQLKTSINSKKDVIDYFENLAKESGDENE